MGEWTGGNLLCFGDNLTFLQDRALFGDECVDLIYLDPPFNSQQSYNVLFKEIAGTPSAAQIKAFEDTWSWDQEANKALSQIHTDPAVPAPFVDLMKTFMNFLRPSPMLAYLVQMAVRLVHMHRVLKKTGTLYLHCDPTASHYLKLILDGIFGPRRFANEIVWERTTGRKGGRQFGRVHDTLLLYTKSDEWTWNPPSVPQDPLTARGHDILTDKDGRRYRLSDLTGAGQGPARIFGGESVNPPTGRHWQYDQEGIDRLWNEGRVVFSSAGKPRLKTYLDQLSGVAVRDVWSDIQPINASAAERMGYPTQKPLGLLKRIVTASSSAGDVILDPFCGCGTTIDAVETLNREGKRRKKRVWIGIDITHIAINLIKMRLNRFRPPPAYQTIGEPQTLTEAAVLARTEPYQFQFWALGLIGARSIGQTKRKGADRGIDGVRYFLDEQKAGAMVTKRMLVQVKGGHVKSGDIRDFVGALSREGAELGAFITLEGPTQPMKAEAASAGMYTSPWDKRPYPKVQVLTIEELLADPSKPNPRCLMIPGGVSDQHTLPEAPRHIGHSTRQGRLVL